ncbi:hypothetical protein PSP6_270133 [Paraburkholderia tropica]|nr:hypothetical protein PSP6_270133 [Paraburkholderia tropica]
MILASAGDCQNLRDPTRSLCLALCLSIPPYRWFFHFHFRSPAAAI